MDTLEAMRVFAAVVDRSGFSAAADALDLSTTSVTRQVAALEKRLGTRLLNRTTRRVSLTSAGAAYYQRAVQLLAELDDIEAAVGAQALAPSGLLRINAPVSFGIARLGPLLAGYRVRYPQVKLDLSLNDRLVDMVEEGFDVAIRITRQPAPNLIARKLADARILLCASPDYLARAGTPATPDALSQHACLAYSYWAGGDEWTLQGPGRETTVHIGGCLRANNGDVLREAALAGMGIVLQPDFVVGEDIAAGRLVRVLPDWHFGSAPVTLLVPTRKGRTARVQALVTFLEQCAAAGAL